MKNKTCLFFGYLATEDEKFNGQTIRTRNVKRLLEDNLKWSVTTYDTQLLPKRPWSIIKYLFKIPFYDSVFLLPAHRGVKVLLPLVVAVASLFNKQIYYVAIGGWLPSYLQRYKYLNYFMKKVSVLLVQTRNMYNELQSKVLPAKVEIFPNFKFYDYAKHTTLRAEESTSLKVVFISRVCLDKGLDTVKSIAEVIDKEKLKINIDLFGPIAPEDETYLSGLLSQHDSIKYGGILSLDLIFSTLSEYDVMLFPTHHMTEGFPGVILDAYIAGIPIIASNWENSQEFVSPDFGFIFNHNDPNEAVSYLKKLINDPSLLLSMKENSYRNREKFSTATITQKFQSFDI